MSAWEETMKLKFRIMSILRGYELNRKMSIEGWEYMYRHLEGYNWYILTEFQPHQIMTPTNYRRLLKNI